MAWPKLVRDPVQIRPAREMLLGGGNLFASRRGGARPPILEAPTLGAVTRRRPLVIVDGGARGELFEPLNTLSTESRVVVRFEADANAPVVSSEGDVVQRKAIWSEPEHVE